MKAKSIIALFLATLLFSSFSCSASATTIDDPAKWRDEKSHNRWTQAMIFGNASFISYKDQSVISKVEILEDAILLCIDQYNSSYANKLSSLNRKGVPGLPNSIEDINFTAGPDHRKYTHLGWNHHYSDDDLKYGHFDERRVILQNAVEFVFHFSQCCSSAEQVEKMLDAMCNLLYVTHILGDRFHSKVYYGAKLTLLLADDNNDSETVINELRKSLSVLFPNQKSTVRKIDRKLKEISNAIVLSHRKYSEKDKWREIDSEYAEKIKNLLRDNLPDLLKQQNWFTNAFSLDNWNGI